MPCPDITREELAAALAAISRLHQLSARLLHEADLPRLLDEVLAATIELQNADFGDVQLYDPERRALALVAQRGFPARFIERFLHVDENSPTSCGRALKSGRRIIVEDVMTDAAYAPLRNAAVEAGYRAQQSTPLFGRGGELLGVISTHFARPHRPCETELKLTDLYTRHAADAIARNRAENRLRTSEERFRRYFDLGLIGMAITSASNGIVEVNDELCNILGYTREEMLDQAWADLTHPDDIAPDLAQFERVLNGEIDGYSLDKRWIRKDGRIVHSIMTARCVRRADGTVDYFVGLVQDITKRKDAEDRLAASERRFRMLIDAIPHHVWSCHRDGTMGYWNQRLVDYTGLSSDELRGDVCTAVHPDDMQRLQATWRDAIEHGREYEIELRLRGRDGLYRRFVSHAVPVGQAGGETPDGFIEWLGTNTDVEDRERAEEALADARFHLSRVMRVTTMGELIASIAHEINQPLAAIATNAHACLRWLRAPVANLLEAAASAERIVRDARHAADVISRIRAFLQREPREHAATDVAEAIKDAVGLVQAEIRHRGISVRVALSPGLPPAIADRVQLRQVILNLVMNAIEAMSAVPVRSLSIAATRVDTDIVVTVRDSGVGIAAEHLHRIFDAFYTSKTDGMGMGLTITRSIIEAHGGRLWATPNEGGGMTFRFTLPVTLSLPP